MKSTLERLKEYNDLNDVTMAHNDGTSGETHKIILAIISLKLIQMSNKKVKVNLNRQWKKRSKNGVKGP